MKIFFCCLRVHMQSLDAHRDGFVLLSFTLHQGISVDSPYDDCISKYVIYTNFIAMVTPCCVHVTVAYLDAQWIFGWWLTSRHGTLIWHWLDDQIHNHPGRDFQNWWFEQCFPTALTRIWLSYHHGMWPHVNILISKILYYTQKSSPFFCFFCFFAKTEGRTLMKETFISIFKDATSIL